MDATTDNPGPDAAPGLAAALEGCLERVAERAGDPSPRVYDRLFELAPELRPLFAGDPSGAVRGEMLNRVLETVLDLAAGGGWARGMIAAEAANHEGIGVAPDRFPLFLVAVADAFRDVLGDEWTSDDERAWRWATESVAALSARA